MADDHIRYDILTDINERTLISSALDLDVADEEAGRKTPAPA